MAQIIEHGPAEDGYRATVRLLDGRELHLRWLQQPADLATAVMDVEVWRKVGEIMQWAGRAVRDMTLRW